MDFWERIKLSFGFQNHFGNNWSAFWDMLEFECPANRVTVIGANTLPQSWKTANGITFLDMMVELLYRNKELRAKYNEEFNYEFIDA